MEVGGMDEHEHRTQRWDTLFPTGGDLYALALGVIGIILIIVALVAHNDAVILAGLIGVYFVGACLWITLTPARHVEVDATGRVSFTSRSRTLIVEPGQLKAVTSVAGFNANRLIPMLVRTNNGKIRFKPPTGTSDELWEALERANPQARLASPHPWLFR
jgi:hypothetical protein